MIDNFKQALKKLDKQFTYFVKFHLRKPAKTTQGIWGWTITHTPTETTAFSTSDLDDITEYFTLKGNTTKSPKVWYKGKEITLQEFYDICHKK
jgi:hypothetical protein